MEAPTVGCSGSLDNTDALSNARPQVQGGESNSNADAEDLSTLLAVIQDDMRHVHVRITAAIAIAGVFVTQIPLEELRAQPTWGRTMTVAGVVLLALAAAFYFQYTQQLNKLRLRIVAERFGPLVGPAAESWRQQFPETSRWFRVGQALGLLGSTARYGDWHGLNTWLFRIGQSLLLLGSACVGVVLVRLLLFE